MDASRDLLDLLDLLEQPPSEAAWAVFVEAAEKLPDSALEGLLPEMLARLSAWPDHLRAAPVRWTEERQERRLSLCQTMPLLPDLDLMDAFSAELVAVNYEEPAYTAYHHYTSSYNKVLRAMTFCTVTQVLYVAESIFQPHGSPNEGWDILFQIDYRSGTSKRLLTLPRAVQTHKTHCDLLHLCKDGQLVCVIQQGESVEYGDVFVFVLRGDEIVHRMKLPGTMERRPPVQQRSHHARVALSEDEGTLWAYLYPDRIMRLDMNTFTSHSEGGYTHQVSDLVPVNSGAVTVTSNAHVVYTDAHLLASGLPLPSPGSSQEVYILMFTAIHALLTKSGYEVPAGTAGSLVLWRLAAGRWDPELMQFHHVPYQRARYEDRYFRFRRIRYQGNWRVAFLEPPEFAKLVVLEFPTGLRAELSTWATTILDDDEAFGFVQDGDAIVYHDRISFRIWRFHLAVPITD
jgi:hypothetical protein